MLWHLFWCFCPWLRYVPSGISSVWCCFYFYTIALLKNFQNTKIRHCLLTVRLVWTATLATQKFCFKWRVIYTCYGWLQMKTCSTIKYIMENLEIKGFWSVIGRLELFWCSSSYMSGLVMNSTSRMRITCNSVKVNYGQVLAS